MNTNSSQSKSEKMKAHWTSGRMSKAVYTPEVRARMSAIKKTHTPWNKGKKMSEEYRQTVARSLRGKTGEQSRNWKGGITSENISARQNEQYSEWRMEVLHRDDFTCQDCGIRGGKLVAHHIKFFSEYPELRYDIDNGVTMCRSCHSRFHNSNKNTI